MVVLRIKSKYRFDFYNSSWQIRIAHCVPIIFVLHLMKHFTVLHFLQTFQQSTQRHKKTCKSFWKDFPDTLLLWRITLLHGQSLLLEIIHPSTLIHHLSEVRNTFTKSQDITCQKLVRSPRNPSTFWHDGIPPVTPTLNHLS